MHLPGTVLTLFNHEVHYRPVVRDFQTHSHFYKSRLCRDGIFYRDMDLDLNQYKTKSNKAVNLALPE